MAPQISGLALASQVRPRGITRTKSAPSLLCRSQRPTLIRDFSCSKSSTEFDGYQVFQIDNQRCHVLKVTVVRGKGIRRGKLIDWLSRPDPYVSVQVHGIPNGQKRTRHINSNSEPEWNQELTFYLDAKRNRLVEIVLYDLNRTVNEEIGRELVNLEGLEWNKDHPMDICYKNGSRIEVLLRIETNIRSSLRFNLELGFGEAEFRAARIAKVYEGLKRLLGEDRAPKTMQETPTVCVMTSGGGFRAMIAYAGAYRALARSGLLDCATYVAALSGSSWFLSTLYSHPDFPWDQELPDKILREIRTCVEKHWQVHLSPPWSSRYLRKIITKSVGGQPVSFTDFYGYLVGQQLLKGRMKARLSWQREKISSGAVPMPVYTCLHVKSNVSAKVFQEWYEFSPYEVAIPKYGVSIRTEDFASKFYAGQKIKSFPEVPLHFLYGVWGSAFTILFKRLVQEKGRNGQSEVLRMIRAKHEEPTAQIKKDDLIEEDELLARCIEVDDDGSSEEEIPNGTKDVGKGSTGSTTLCLEAEEIVFSSESGFKSEEEEEESGGDASEDVSAGQTQPIKASSARMFRSKTYNALGALVSPPTFPSLGIPSFFNSPPSDDHLADGDEFPEAEEEQRPATTKSSSTTLRQRLRKYSLPKMRKKNQSLPSALNKLAMTKQKSLDMLEAQDPLEAKGDNVSPTPSECIDALEKEPSTWDRMLERALTTTPLDSRAFRAGVILNPLRGLVVEENDRAKQAIEQRNFSPVKPTDRSDCDFKGYREATSTDAKKIYLVDSGLSFNLPFPLMLRPQRGIQLYITMDFSSRHSDSTPPFRELLLAEKWARVHNLPFPPIRDKVKTFLEQPIKECYVFKSEAAETSLEEVDDPCPTVIFFPLVNASFREYKAPGRLRETDDEKLFGDFRLFDDTSAYAIWRFVYPNLSYDRLTAMMEYNILNNLDVIEHELELLVARIRRQQNNNTKTSDGCA